MADDAIVTIGLRNEFYRDNYRRILFALSLSIIINVVLGIVIVVKVLHPPSPVYFATSTNGRITPLYPLDKPNQSDSAILQWANQAAISAYSYDFVNYRAQLQAAAGFFTSSGWRQFVDQLKASNNLAAVEAKKLVVSAVATAAPVIIEKGLYSGSYSWRIQMPLLVTFQSASEFTQANYVVTMLITRISTLNSAKGIGIAQFVVAPE